MKKPFYLLSFGLAVTLTLSAGAQTTGQSQDQSQPTTQTPPVNSTTPATNIGSGAQTKAGTPATSPANSTTPGQVSPTGTGVPPAQNAPASGGVSGAASSSTTQPAGNNASATGVATMTDSDLEGQIQNALNKEPTLSGDSTQVKVTADSIELNGNVGTNKEKITATRIVQSYAGSRKLVNHLSIGGKSGSTTAPRPEQDQTDRSGNTDRGNSGNPAGNPEPNKGSRPPKK